MVSLWEFTSYKHTEKHLQAEHVCLLAQMRSPFTHLELFNTFSLVKLTSETLEVGM